MLQTRLPYLSQKRPGRWQFNAQNINKVVSDVCSCCTKTKLIKTINSRSSSIVILNVEQLRRWQWLLLAFLLLVVFIGTGIGIGSNIIINLINVAIIWSWMSFTSQVCSGCLRWGGCVQRWLRKHQQHLPPTGIIGTTLFANLLDPSLDWSFHAINNNSRTMRWVRIIKNRNIKLILIVKTQFLIQWTFHVYRSFLKYTYGSDSAGRGKCLFYVFFF